MRNQRGITLVALVVTIIVLLILAAVSIAMLRGDSGIITNAQNAKYANIESEVIDRVYLAYNGVVTEIKVKDATQQGYNATAATSVASLAKLVAVDLGGTGTGFTGATGSEDINALNGKYTVSYTGAVISVAYEDSDFKLKTGTPASKYNKIQYTITMSHESTGGNKATRACTTPGADTTNVIERQVGQD